MTESRTAVFQTPSIYVVISGQWKTLVPVPNKHVLLRLVVFVLELSGLLFVLRAKAVFTFTHVSNTARKILFQCRGEFLELYAEDGYNC